MQNAGEEPEHRRGAYLVQLTVRAVQQVAASFSQPDEGVTAERSVRCGFGTVRLFAGAEAEESKLALDSAWCQVDRPVLHGTRVQEAAAGVHSVERSTPVEWRCADV